VLQLSSLLSNYQQRNVTTVFDNRYPVWKVRSRPAAAPCCVVELQPFAWLYIGGHIKPLYQPEASSQCCAYPSCCEPHYICVDQVCNGIPRQLQSAWLLLLHWAFNTEMLSVHCVLVCGCRRATARSSSWMQKSGYHQTRCTRTGKQPRCFQTSPVAVGLLWLQQQR
jgi:hypothetical protein